MNEMRGHGKEMMHDRAGRALGEASSYSILLACAGFIACAGGETPRTNPELRDQITAVYVNGDGPVGSAGNGAGGSAQAEAGSGGDDGEPGGRGGSGPSRGGAGSDECDGFAVLEENCGTSGCHGQDSLYSNFAESEAAALSYVGESGESSCADEGPLLDPDNPVASIIIQKVTASSPPCGAPMPVVGDLSEADIACLQEWIGTL
jgi:hypothetical protein